MIGKGVGDRDCELLAALDQLFLIRHLIVIQKEVVRPVSDHVDQDVVAACGEILPCVSDRDGRQANPGPFLHRAALVQELNAVNF